MVSMSISTVVSLAAVLSVVSAQGSVYDSGVAIQDHVAQAACMAYTQWREGWTYAVRRYCSGTQTCSQICALSSLKTDTQTASFPWECSTSLHIYDPFNNAGAAQNALRTKTYNYASCEASSCGPNYCCCFVKYN